MPTRGSAIPGLRPPPPRCRRRAGAKPKMPRGEAPTTSERIGSYKGAGQWGVNHKGARDWPLGTPRKGGGLTPAS